MPNLPLVVNRLYVAQLPDYGRLEAAATALVAKMVSEKPETGSTITLIGPHSLRAPFLLMFERVEGRGDTVIVEGVPVTYIGTMSTHYQSTLSGMWLHHDQFDLVRHEDTTPTTQDSPVPSSDQFYLSSLARSVAALRGKFRFDIIEDYLYTRSPSEEVDRILEQAGWTYGSISHDHGTVKSVWMIPLSNQAA